MANNMAAARAAMAAKRAKAAQTEEVLDAPNVGEPIEIDGHNETWEAASKKSKIIKIDKLYPPKIRNMTHMNYAGKNMEDFFPDKTIKHADFTDADLSGADFTGFNLQGSIFKNTNISNTNFQNADLRWSIINGLIGKSSANFEGARLAEIQGG